jgi:hypothetical protein
MDDTSRATANQFHTYKLKRPKENFAAWQERGWSSHYHILEDNHTLSKTLQGLKIYFFLTVFWCRQDGRSPYPVPISFIEAPQRSTCRPTTENGSSCQSKFGKAWILQALAEDSVPTPRTPKPRSVSTFLPQNKPGSRRVCRKNQSSSVNSETSAQSDPLPEARFSTKNLCLSY